MGVFSEIWNTVWHSAEDAWDTAAAAASTAVETALGVATGIAFLMLMAAIAPMLAHTIMMMILWLLGAPAWFLAAVLFGH